MQKILGFFSSPTWMTIANAAVGGWAVLESTGVTNMLGQSKAGAVVIASAAAINAFAHSISQPVAGPAAAAVGTSTKS